MTVIQSICAGQRNIFGNCRSACLDDINPVVHAVLRERRRALHACAETAHRTEIGIFFALYRIYQHRILGNAAGAVLDGIGDGVLALFGEHGVPVLHPRFGRDGYLHVGRYVAVLVIESGNPVEEVYGCIDYAVDIVCAVNFGQGICLPGTTRRRRGKHRRSD